MSEAGREHALSIINTLRVAGHQALLAGGCVRDMLLGHEPSDFDVVTDATPEVVMSLFPRTLPVGVSFGVIRVLGSRGVGEVEVATFRSDGEYSDGRRPDSVTFGNARDDAMRRDFTINGMFFDPVAGEVIDYVGGRDDLRAGVVRAIGDPIQRFSEDKLRLLRAIRFASRFDFAIEPSTWSALHDMAPQVTQVSVERITQEWRRMIVDPHRAIAMDSMRRSGLIAALLPELEAIADDRDPTIAAHNTVWSVTMHALRLLPMRPSFTTAMTALLHGINSITAIEEITRRLKLSTAESERIVWLSARRRVLIHLCEGPPSGVKRVLAAPGIHELLDLQRAITSATTGDDRHVRFLESYLRDKPNGPINPPPLITGRDLIEAGLRPGPKFSELLERVRDAQLDGSIMTKEEAIDMAIRN